MAKIARFPAFVTDLAKVKVDELDGKLVLDGFSKKEIDEGNQFLDMAPMDKSDLLSAMPKCVEHLLNEIGKSQ